jgi:hypothetical protein
MGGEGTMWLYKIKCCLYCICSACLFVDLWLITFVLSLFLLALHPAENSLFEPSPDPEVLAGQFINTLSLSLSISLLF